MLHGQKSSFNHEVEYQCFFAQDINMKSTQSVCSKTSLIPISFKGLILLQIWKKSSQRASTSQQTRSQLSLQQRRQIQIQKRQYLIRWHFKTFNKKIIGSTINNVLSQQTVSKGSLFYRLKRLVADQKQKTIIQLTKKNQLYQQQQCKKINKVHCVKEIETIITKTEKAEQKNHKIANNIPSKSDSSKIKQVKAKIRTKTQDKLIQRIENEMAQQFKKLDKIIHKVKQIRSSSHQQS